MPTTTHPRVTRSALVGAVATLTDLLVMVAAVEVAGLAPRTAAPLALATGVVVQFLGNKLYAFRDRSRAWLSQTVPFVSKAIGVRLAKLAMKVMMGRSLRELGLTQAPVPVHFSVNEAVFPFQ